MAGKGNGAASKVVNGPGTFTPQQVQDILCENFVATLHEWCARTPAHKRGCFNNAFYKNLNKNHNAFSKAMGFMREYPLIFSRAAGGGLVMQSAKAASAGAGALATAAGAIYGIYRAATGGGGRPYWNGLQQQMGSTFRGAGLSGHWAGFPDGLSKNGRHWLEIKRPKDTLSDWQKKQHDTFKTQTGGSVHMADCNCPGANCKDGDDCPEGYASAA